MKHTNTIMGTFDSMTTQSMSKHDSIVRVPLSTSRYSWDSMHFIFQNLQTKKLFRSLL